MVQIYYGDAKGKTTAAVGQSIRASASGMKVLFTQFLKDFTSGEITVLKSVDNIEVLDKYKVTDFVFYMNDEQKEKTKQDMLNLAKLAFEKTEKDNFQMLVLDEILDVIDMKWIDEEFVISWLNKLKDVEVVMTGRNPSEELKSKADYISKLCCEKHPYNDNFIARVGIEF